MQFKSRSAHRNFVNFAVGLAVISLASLWTTLPVLAMTQELQFETNTGYKIETRFSYDESKNYIGTERNKSGQSIDINSMNVKFYKPSGELIADYNNIVDGAVTGNYFEFNFDPLTRQLSGNIDLGGESAGEMYLKGKADGELSLIEVNELGEETTIDLVSKRLN